MNRNPRVDLLNKIIPEGYEVSCDPFTEKNLILTNLQTRSKWTFSNDLSLFTQAREMLSRIDRVPDDEFNTYQDLFKGSPIQVVRAGESNVEISTLADTIILYPKASYEQRMNEVAKFFKKHCWLPAAKR